MIPWHSWRSELLDLAAAGHRPVLLLLVARWSRFCDELLRTTFADAELAAAIARDTVPVKADVDAEPGLAARYGRGGWPSVVLLHPDGRVLAGGTFVEAPTLAAWLERALALVRDGRERQEEPGPAASHETPAAPARPVGKLHAGILPAIEHALLVQFDDRHGGFGTAAKFPHPEALDFAILRHGSRPDARLLEVLEKTLAHMAAGGLRDHVEGGFFRYCEKRDWSQPHSEKLLETNVGLARNYIEAGQLLGRRDWLAVGSEALEVVLRDLRDDALGLLHSGLDPDDDYYAQGAAGRATRRPPARSGRFLADANARAVSALLKAGAVLRRTDLTHAALALAESLLRRLWRPGHGMYHQVDGGQRQHPGLLRDQAETARCLLQVLQYTDDRRFLAPLEDLVEVMAGEHLLPSGDFGDRAQRRSRGAAEQAIVESAVAAEVMLRGALLLARPSLAELARRALELHAQDFRRYGYAMAAYGRSVELVLHPPLHIVVVGAAGEARTRELFKAASATYLPSRVVQQLDSRRDAASTERLGLPAGRPPTAYVFLARDGVGAFTDAAALRQGLLAANARRLRA